MILKRWEDLPDKLKTEAVKPYYDALCHKKGSLITKRIFDIIASAIMIIILSPLLLIIGTLIKLDDEGPVFYRQVRVTQYGREFKIFKFRTMVIDAEKKGAQITSQSDPRITKIGFKLRKYRLDEIPQLFNIFIGDMSFVGTRPEVKKYVNSYTDEMMATLLVPAGVTSEASVMYKDESEIIGKACNVDEVYIERILPEKMKYNLAALRKFSIWQEFAMLFKTIVAVVR